jgi:hypothetical protein
MLMQMLMQVQPSRSTGPGSRNGPGSAHTPGGAFAMTTLGSILEA